MKKQIKIVILLFFSAFFIPVEGTLQGEPTREAPTVENLIKKDKFLDTLAEMHIRSLTKQYQLSPEQVEQAKKIYTPDDWKLRYKVGGQMERFGRKMNAFLVEKKEPSLPELRRLIDDLYPLVEKNISEISAQNDRFHAILNKDQQKQHQKQLDETKKEFAELTERLQRWRKQGLEPGELQANFGDDRSYQLARKQAKGEKIDPQADNTDFQPKLYNPEDFDFWEMYVKEFIQAFKLDKTQQTQVWSVLSEIKIQAEQYKKDHHREYSEIRAKFANFRAGGHATTNPAERFKTLRSENQKRLDELNKPHLAMFDELKTRLMKIPTDFQRKQAAELLKSVSVAPDEHKSTSVYLKK